MLSWLGGSSWTENPENLFRQRVPFETVTSPLSPAFGGGTRSKLIRTKSGNYSTRDHVGASDTVPANRLNFRHRDRVHYTRCCFFDNISSQPVEMFTSCTIFYQRDVQVRLHLITSLHWMLGCKGQVHQSHFQSHIVLNTLLLKWHDTKSTCLSYSVPVF